MPVAEGAAERGRLRELSEFSGSIDASSPRCPRAPDRPLYSSILRRISPRVRPLAASTGDCPPPARRDAEGPLPPLRLRYSYATQSEHLGRTHVSPREGLFLNDADTEHLSSFAAWCDRFKVPAGSVEREFLDVVKHRHALMSKYPGFIDSNIDNPVAELWVYTTRWTEKVRVPPRTHMRARMMLGVVSNDH